MQNKKRKYLHKKCAVLSTDSCSFKTLKYLADSVYQSHSLSLIHYLSLSLNHCLFSSLHFYLVSFLSLSIDISLLHSLCFIHFLCVYVSCMN